MAPLIHAQRERAFVGDERELHRKASSDGTIATAAGQLVGLSLIGGRTTLVKGDCT
jgi:hypothetical protein